MESKPGEGTRLLIALPRSEAPAAGPAQDIEDVPARGGKETILLVEDEVTVRKHVLRALAGAGYEVDLAGDGKEALEVAESLERAPDLVLSDIVMPRLSGTRLAEALRLRWPGIRVLLMSGYAEDRLEPTGVLRSTAEFIQKPFTGSTLLRRIRSMLDRPTTT
jgi:DNA-binding response OmpR family regulator